MFLLFLWFFNTVDSGLKIAGLMRRGDRIIQGRLKRLESRPGDEKWESRDFTGGVSLSCFLFFSFGLFGS